MGLSRETLAARVRDAVTSSGRSQRDIADAVGMDHTAFNKALAGRRDFKSLEIALLAEELGVRTDDLLADDDVERRQPVAIAARTQLGAGPAVDAAIRFAEDLLDLDRLLSELGHPARPAGIAWPSVNRTTSPAVQGQTLAGALHRRLNPNGKDFHLPYSLDELAELLERGLGVDIAFRPLPEGLDGLSLSAGNFRLALVSSSIVATRQRFTLAHEVCHLLAGDDSLTVDVDVLRDNSDQERRANAFAAAFLMPERVLKNAAQGGSLSEENVVDLLGRLGVSRDALAIQLHSLRLIGEEDRDRIRRMNSARITSRPGRAADLQARDRSRAPGNLLERATAAYVAGDLGILPLARLLDKDPDRLLDELTPPTNSTDAEAAYRL